MHFCWLKGHLKAFNQVGLYFVNFSLLASNTPSVWMSGTTSIYPHTLTASENNLNRMSWRLLTFILWQFFDTTAFRSSDFVEGAAKLRPEFLGGTGPDGANTKTEIK